MKVFNELVFDQKVSGNQRLLSSPVWNETLGKADELVLEVEIVESTAASFTVEYLHSNSGLGFVVAATPFNAVSLTAPYRGLAAVSGPTGALGQVGVKLPQTTDAAWVRIWACGRTR